jgi:hypothetical protein
MNMILRYLILIICVNSQVFLPFGAAKHFLKKKFP